MTRCTRRSDEKVKHGVRLPFLFGPGGGGCGERGNANLPRERLGEDQAHGGGGRHAVFVDVEIGEVGKSRIGEQTCVLGGSQRQC